AEKPKAGPPTPPIPQEKSPISTRPTVDQEATIKDIFSELKNVINTKTPPAQPAPTRDPQGGVGQPVVPPVGSTTGAGPDIVPSGKTVEEGTAKFEIKAKPTEATIKIKPDDKKGVDETIKISPPPKDGMLS
ncbi:MAG: hypothetical protein KJ967_04495, partial [Elusimicrobia bacterium]|nr:hypothetical protein [Elusimicrobiota bacterium]